MRITFFAACLALPVQAQPYNSPSGKYPPHCPPALVQRAQKGDPVAMYDLLDGYFTPCISDEDRRYWKKLCWKLLPPLAEKGDVEAMARVGYQWGHIPQIKPITPEQKTKGLEYLKQAADAGSVLAMGGMYDEYVDHSGGLESPRRQYLNGLLKKWWPGIKKRIDAGDAEALYESSRGLFQGIEGVPMNQEMVWLRKAAEGEYRPAMLGLAEKLVEINPDEALLWCERAADLGDWKGALEGARLAASQWCNIEGDAGWNPQACANLSNELAAQAEKNCGCRCQEIKDFWDWRIDLSQPSSDEDSSTGGEAVEE